MVERVTRSLGEEGTSSDSPTRLCPLIDSRIAKIFDVLIKLPNLLDPGVPKYC